MLSPTPFQQFLLPRIIKASERLRSQVWRTDSTALEVRRGVPCKGHVALDEALAGPFEPVGATPVFWGRMFDQCWWKVQVPPAEGVARSKPRYLHWLDQGEATIYINGEPYFGIDPGHRYAPLPEGFSGELIIESLCARTGVWVEGEAQGVDPVKGSRFDGAYLAERNEDAWHALHDLEVLIQVVSLLSRPEYPQGYDLWGRGGYRPELSVAEPLLRRLIDRMNDAVDALDRQGVPACRAKLSEIYRDFPAAPEALTAVLTGHAHIDLVWLWPERAGEFKAVHSFANAIRAIERYPEVMFGYSQPASYEAVQRRSPGLMRQVREKIDAGRWEPTGAMYVESDVQLPCGEALVRAFALGQQGFRELRGSDSRCVWLPDVFGYSACLPTIMAGFDVPYFYTTKMHWSGATRFPFSSFKWVGMDGSAVVSHISWHHYNQRVRPDEFRRLAMQHRQSAVHDEGLFPCGFGDGGGGLNDEMCERARRLANLASMPRAKWGSIETFFDRLADKQDRLPNWRGEMYLEYHRGVQTTHSHLKAAFRAAERGLQVWEAVRCATGGGPVDEQMWKRVCFAQFHDYIPGSSIQEVYDEHVPELQGIAEKALQRAAQELAATAGNAAEPCVFNPLPVERCVLIDGRLVELPPLAGVAVVGLKALDAPKVKASEKSLSNNRLEAAFNALGEVVSLTVEGHQLALDGPAAQLWTFADIPAIYDAWDIDRYTLSSGTHQTGQAACKVESAEGGLSGSVAFTRSLGELGDVTLRYKLEAGSAVLGIEVDLDLRAKQTLVKLVFPTGYRGREARYGGPFGSVRRPQWDGPLANDAAFENPASRWAVVADDDERDGLMVITEAKYGFGAREGLMHLSLARSAMVTPTNIVGDTTSLGAADEGVTFADLGRQHIRLAVGRFRADAPREQQPAVLADTLFTPVLRYAGQPVDAGLRGIDGPASLVPCWAVPESAQRWTLRLHETLGSRGELGLQLAAGRSAVATDLRGQPARKSTPGQAVSPYSLQSYAIQI